MLKAAGELVAKTTRSRAYAEKLRRDCAIFDGCNDSVLQHIKLVGAREVTSTRVRDVSAALRDAVASGEPGVEHEARAPERSERNQAATQRRTERQALDRKACCGDQPYQCVLALGVTKRVQYFSQQSGRHATLMCSMCVRVHVLLQHLYSHVVAAVWHRLDQERSASVERKVKACLHSLRSCIGGGSDR